MFSHFLLHMFKFDSFIIVYLVQIYIGLLESFLQIPVLSFHFVMFHVLCHKLLNNNSRLFGNNFLFVSHIILGVFCFTISDSFNICNVCPMYACISNILSFHECLYSMRLLVLAENLWNETA